MQVRLTVRAGGAAHDVQVTAARGACLADVRAPLLALLGRSGEDPLIWSGRRALAPDALIGDDGMRDGSDLSLDGPLVEEPVGAVLQLHVVGGPDAGVVHALGRGLITVGRDSACQVRLTDPDVSRRHIELAVTTNGVRIRDVGSTNGSQVLSDEGDPSDLVGADWVTLPIGRYVEIGETLLCVVAATVPAAATSPAEDGRVAVNRPPRLVRHLPDREVVLDPEPEVARRTALPWLAALLPAAAGAGLAWYLHNVQFLAFALLSPLLMFGSAFGDRLSGRSHRRSSRAERVARAAGHTAQIRTLATAETAFRRAADPDAAALLVTATRPTARLWERRRGDRDLLQVRVGVGSAPATFTVRRSNAAVPTPMLAAVPLTVNLRDGPLGVCGPRPLAAALARSMITQLAVLHSPADVAVAALLPTSAASWSWLRWLPHVANPLGESAVARSTEQSAELVRQLNGLLETRAESIRPDSIWTGPWLVLLLDGVDSSEVSGFGRILEDGSRLGITAICIDEDPRRLPAGCVAIASLTGDHGSRVRLRTATGRDQLALADRVSRSWADRIARALSPLRDPDDDAAAVPTTVRLLDLLNLRFRPGGQPETGIESTLNQVRAQWRRADGEARTCLGIGRDGPVEIDLARDGPHLLVAGTTGSGKSELLRSLVAGMAANTPPTDLQFVLIDYKGGAAFADCARLPHTSGLVTDLDPHLTRRALVSLDAELLRRERSFATVGAGDLTAYRIATSGANAPAAEPIPRLVIVVDEFAALADELPDFVTGLVGIAQRGRSLGVHLVLATQRPGGVVSPEIRANTAVRIALRVTDPGESSDVVGRPDAARIDRRTPGRAVLATGEELVLLQTAHVGAGPASPPAGATLVRLDDWGSPIGGDVATAVNRPDDLVDLVDLLCRAARDCPPSRRPWLDPLPAVVSTRSLPTRTERFVVAYALADHPHEQRQTLETLDLAAGGSLLLTGTARSGRTTAARTIAASAATQLCADDLHLYLIDAGGGLHSELAALPHCGAALGANHGREIDRLLSRLSLEVARRRESGGRPLPDTDRPAAPPALLLVIDGWEAFAATVDSVASGDAVDALLRLLRDGPAVGLTVLITGDRASLTARLTGSVQRRLVLRLADRDDYVLAGIPRADLPARFGPGRAVGPDGVERQLAIFDEPWPPVEPFRPALRRAPFRIRPLPSQVRLSELPAPSVAGGIVLGLAGDAAEPVTVSVGTDRPGVGAGQRFMIVGPPRSGRSTALATIVEQSAGRGERVLIMTGTRSPLADRVGHDTGPAVGPDASPDHPTLAAARAALLTGHALTIVVDDTEQFLDTASGDWLALLARTGPRGLAIFATARTDDVAVAYRGVASELRRHRTGLLLRPGPGDGDIFGIRLPYSRFDYPPGRGYLIADAVTNPAGTADATSAGRSDGGALPIQVAVS